MVLATATKAITAMTTTHLAAALAAALALSACGRSEPNTFFRVSDEPLPGARPAASAAPDAVVADVDDGGAGLPHMVRPVFVEGSSDESSAMDRDARTAATDNRNKAADRRVADRHGRRTHTVAASPPPRRSVARDGDPAAQPTRPMPPDKTMDAPRPARAPAAQVAVREPRPERTEREAQPAAVARDPGQARDLNRRAIALINGGQPDGAVPMLERAAALHPRDAEILGNLGYAYMLTGEHGKARMQFTRALDLAPDRSATWLNLGQTYAELGQRDVAVDAVVKGYRYSTRKPSVRSALHRAATGERFSPEWREAAGLALRRIGDDGRSVASLGP